jgi:L,D-transpeptidase YbiS
MKIMDYIARNILMFLAMLIIQWNRKRKLLIYSFSTLFFLIFTVYSPILFSGFLFQNTPEVFFQTPLVNVYSLLEAKKDLERQINVCEKKLASRIPSTGYLVINSSENEFRLYRGKKLLRSGLCSTGSYILLEKGEDQKWMFKTPRGQYRVQTKTINPVWKKPDWAFVEAGLPVPPVGHRTRYEYGVLGDYSLSIGNGYLIHGTLYQRFMGLPVTHGCVRLNDEDLETVYYSLSEGAKVYIY